MARRLPSFAWQTWDEVAKQPNLDKPETPEDRKYDAAVIHSKVNGKNMEAAQYQLDNTPAQCHLDSTTNSASPDNDDLHVRSKIIHVSGK